MKNASMYFLVMFLVSTGGCSREQAAGASPPSRIQTAGESATSAPPAPESGNLDAGAQVYSIYCQNCHGQQGRGDGPVAAGLNPKPASFADGAFRIDANGDGKPGEIDDITAVVRDGAAKYGGSPMMAPWPSLSDEQLQGVVQHVKALSPSRGAP